MNTAQATELSNCNQLYVLPNRAPARSSKWQLIAAPLILAACLWMHAQNVALEQRVDQDVAAWAAIQ